MESSTCHYCDKPAEFLCDFVLEACSYMTKPLPAEDDPLKAEKFMDCFLTAEPEVKTCDRGLCEDHRHFSGSIFYDGSKGGWIDSQDFCPGHAGAGDHKPDYDPLGTPRGPGDGKRKRMAA